MLTDKTYVNYLEEVVAGLLIQRNTLDDIPQPGIEYTFSPFAIVREIQDHRASREADPITELTEWLEQVRP